MATRMKKEMKNKKKEMKNKDLDLDLDFRCSVVGTERFLDIMEFNEEEIEVCVDFFEKFVKQDLPRYLKAEEALRAYVNAALCVGDDKLRERRIKLLYRIDTFLTNIADFRCRFEDGY